MEHQARADERGKAQEPGAKMIAEWALIWSTNHD
jgi:hypothetical protein